MWFLFTYTVKSSKRKSLFFCIILSRSVVMEISEPSQYFISGIPIMSGGRYANPLQNYSNN